MNRRELFQGLAGLASGLILARRVMANDRAPSPDRLASDDPRIAWWRDARFGLFIHWSISGAGDAVAAGFERQIATFSAPAFDAEAWAQLALDAGARYVVLVCRHADGFCFWPSRHSESTVAKTPLGLDVVGKVATACRRQGLRFGCYLALPDLRHPDWPRGPGPDGARKQDFRRERFLAYLQAQVRELVESYQPSILWFDGDNEAPWTHGDGLALYRTCRALSPEVLVNDRVDKGRQGLKRGDGKRPEDFGYKPGDDVELFNFFRAPRPPGEYAGDFATPEQEVGRFDRLNPWETCMTLGENWFWNRDERLKTSEELVGVLARCAGGDGNLLLNVCPRGDGSLDMEQVERLRGVGKWLAVNGHAIYGTRGGPWMPGKHGVSTCAGSRVNLIVLDHTIHEIDLPVLPVNVTECRLAGVRVSHRIANGRFRVALPDAQANEPARILTLHLARPAAAIAPLASS